MDVFCVVSAIGNDYGHFPYKDRFNQLVGTIHSIRKFAPNSHICLYDTSYEMLPESDIKTLGSMVDNVVCLHEHPYIVHLKLHAPIDSNRTYQKTMGEIVAMMCFLHSEHHLDGFDRIFKISGRYQLTSDFDSKLHHSKPNKVVIKTKNSWYGSAVYPCRLWSFDSKMLPIIKKLFITIHDDTLHLISIQNGIFIIEYSMYNTITKLNIPTYESDILGVSGFFGQDGEPIND